MRMHKLITLLLAFCFLGEVQAQSYPTKPIRLLVGAVAGSTEDGVARILAERLQQALGQPVVVDNKPGAGGVLAMEEMVKSTPDGYAIALASRISLAHVGLYPKPP